MKRAALLMFALAPALHAQPTPTDLIHRALVAQKAQSDRNARYTFREEHITTQLDKNGAPGEVSSRTFNHIMLEGDMFTELVLINNKPLDAKTQKKVDETRERVQAERRRTGIHGLGTKNISLGDLEILAKCFDNKVTGEETILGHTAWRLESEPKSGYKPASSSEKESMAAHKTTWFDKETGAELKQSSAFQHGINSFQPGSLVQMEFAPVGDDWLPSVFRMRVDMKFLPGVHGRVDSIQRYSDYKRFTVDSTLTTQ